MPEVRPEHHPTVPGSALMRVLLFLVTASAGGALGAFLAYLIAMSWR